MVLARVLPEGAPLLPLIISLLQEPPLELLDCLCPATPLSHVLPSLEIVTILGIPENAQQHFFGQRRLAEL